MLKKDRILQEKYNGINPTCHCGCGEKTKYEPGKKDYSKYKRGHLSKVNKSQFGDPKDPKRVAKIIATRKERFASGEYDYIKQAVKDRDNVELGKKISQGAKGIPKPKPEGFGVGRIQSEETRKKMSETAIQRVVKTDGNHSSKLEKTFSNILTLLNINHHPHFYAKDIKAFYDFYLPDYDIIIEVDGDFWHTNPVKYPDGPTHKCQIKNSINDEKKNKWVQDNGYKLLRFWENDINNNINIVKDVLLKNCPPILKK